MNLFKIQKGFRNLKIALKNITIYALFAAAIAAIALPLIKYAYYLLLWYWNLLP